MFKKKYIFSLIILLILCFNSYSKENIYIVYKIKNEIITNIDVNKERLYLITLNRELENLDKIKLLDISKESILKETIKRLELSKYFDLKTMDLNIESYLENFYTMLDIKNELEFEQYLKSNNLTLDYITKKIKIEVFWNQYIYEKYINLINIDENALKIKLNEIKDKEQGKIFFLSEILFEIENNNNFEKKVQNIEQSINEIGFNNTANIYSLSDSSKLGGKVGWIEEHKLSKDIIEKLSLLSKGQHTLPIQTGGNFLILKIEDIKNQKKMIDEEEILKKMIQFETNKKLNRFSEIFFKQIKINQTIDVL